MKVIGINGSPHKNGNTAQAIQTVFDALSSHGIETEMLQLGSMDICGCRDCGHCARHTDARCAVNDGLNEIIEKAVKADGIIIGSPVWFGSVTSNVKSLIDRLGRVTRNQGYLLKNKPGAAVVSARRAGTNFTYATINFLFGISQMITVNSSYWNMTLSCSPDDYPKDTEAHGTFTDLGNNMAWLLEKINR